MTVEAGSGAVQLADPAKIAAHGHGLRAALAAPLADASDSATGEPPDERRKKGRTIVNNINLIGRLTRDPELKSTNAGHPACNMRVGVDGIGSDDTLCIDVTSFGSQARACAEHLERGCLVAIAGRLVYREWQAADGSKRSRHKVVGRVEFLSSPLDRSAAATDSVGVDA